MHFEFDQSAPIYQQLADQIEEMIFSGLFPEGQQVPSTTQLSQELHINPATVLKGMNLLVDHHLLEKKRGLGMFVKKGAKERIMENVKKVSIKTTSSVSSKKPPNYKSLKITYYH